MELKDILNEEADREEAKEAIKERIRSVVDSFVTEEKDGYKEDESSDDENDEEDEDDGDDEMDEGLSESMKVKAHTPSGRSEDIEISRKSELQRYAKTGKYDYFTVTTRDGGETDYSVDPSGNLVEM